MSLEDRRQSRKASHHRASSVQLTTRSHHLSTRSLGHEDKSLHGRTRDRRQDTHCGNRRHLALLASTSARQRSRGYWPVAACDAESPPARLGESTPGLPTRSRPLRPAPGARTIQGPASRWTTSGAAKPAGLPGWISKRFGRGAKSQGKAACRGR